MQLIINSPGVYLKVKEGCFLIKVSENTSEDKDSSQNQSKEFQVSPRKVQSIVIGNYALITTEALKLAVENNIDVIFLDEFGSPYGRLWHSRMGSTATIRRRQLEVCESKVGLDFVKEWISIKIKNQANFVDKLLRARPEKIEQYRHYVEKLRNLSERVMELNGSVDEIRQELLGIEGSSGKMYFEVLSYLIPERWRFEGRSRNPAKDYFNCMLNYAYGVLYGVVERACILAGLDPFIGFFHTDNYAKKSLVFDLIEPYRYIADEVVFYLFSGRQVKQEYFDEVPGGYILNKEGKQVLLQSLNEAFERPIRYRNRNIKQRDVIQFECHRIANILLNKDPNEIEMETKEF